MHRPTELFRSVLCTITIASTLVAANGVLAQDEPTLSDRLTQLRRSWSGEEQQVSHTEAEPEKRSVARDLFDALRGKDAPAQTEAVHVASLPHATAPSRQRAGSVLSTPPQPGVYDIGPALGAAPKPLQKAPVKVASRPAAVSRHTTGDIALDLIGTTASSQDTSGVVGSEPAPLAEPLVMAEPAVETPPMNEQPVLEAPLPAIETAETDEGFASADQAAEFALNPAVLATGEPESPSEEATEAIEVPELSPAEPLDTADRVAAVPAAPANIVGSAQDEIDIDEFNSDQAMTDWNHSTPATPDYSMAPAEPELTASNSANAEQAFNTKPPVVTPQPTTSWNSTPIGVATTSPNYADAENVLVTEQLPLIASRISGPKTILIGREATYRVTLENRGSAGADQLSTEVVAPAWAEVIHTTASAGSVAREAGPNGGTTLRWDVTTLNAGGTQSLDVVLVPKTSQPLSLGVSWRHAPVASTTMVEVQEPKLEMGINGPREVYFGRPQSYRLMLSNPGTGPAENIVVQLMPPGGGQPTSSYRIDRLEAGEAKSVDIEITARDPGELSIRAVAAGDGNLRSEAAQEIFCRHAELNVDWRGPNRKYAGTEAVYYFRVRNPGTASADQTQFEVSLPAGFEFKTASEGHHFDNANQRVTWNVGSLRPGDDRYLELRGIVNQAGNNQLRFTAVNGQGDVRDSAVASTEVVALADLKLDVSDPKGPVPVGSEVEYTIRITNRGRSAAEQVNVVGLFSTGIEPMVAEGSEATIADGRVGFRSISSLPAGQEVTLKIRARATTAGTHLFRAEVLCRDLEIKLAAEETTRFFQDDTRSPEGSPLESASRASRFQ